MIVMMKAIATKDEFVSYFLSHNYDENMFNKDGSLNIHHNSFKKTGLHNYDENMFNKDGSLNIHHNSFKKTGLCK